VGAGGGFFCPDPVVSGMSSDDADPFAEPYEGPVPEGVDEAAVERMRAVARAFDDLFTIPGTNASMGLDPILGAVPGIGDAIGAALELYIVLESARLGVSYGTLVRMLANVTIDVAGGMLPYVGTVVDVVWKANRRNLALALDDLADGAADTVFADAADALEPVSEDGETPSRDDEPVEIPIEEVEE